MLSNAVQITHRYIQEYYAGAQGETPRRQAAQKTMQAMLMPNAAAVATDAAGFLVLGVAKIVLMQQVAAIMTFWMLTIALSGILVPMICSYLPRLTDKKTAQVESQSWLDQAHHFPGRFFYRVGQICSDLYCRDNCCIRRVAAH